MFIGRGRIETLALRQECDVDRSRHRQPRYAWAYMQQENAVIGGEGNGGVIYPRINFARDSLVGMALTIHLLAETGKTVTELLECFPSYSIVKRKMPCPSHRTPAVLRMLRQEFEKFPIDARDGVKVTLPQGWFLVRGSNTEPIIRVVAEATSEAQAREIVDRVYRLVAESIAG